MKKWLKILIPILIILLIVFGAGWYFISYRADLSAEYYVSKAESAMAAGRYERAVSLYSSALEKLPGDEAVSTALADAYRQTGNYTKVEYVLVNAISANPDSVELYLDLSSAYVEQDKLLDADQMLSNIANDSVRETIAQMRPEAPALSPDAGYFDTYIDVSLSYSGGTAYLAVGSDYPSIAGGAYAEPVRLPPGESQVSAIVVSADGLVSPVARNGYTIGNVVDSVTFADDLFDAYIRGVLHKSSDAEISSLELWAVTALELPEGLSSIEDLQWFVGLQSLTASNLNGLDFASALSRMPDLETLNLSGCTIPDATLNVIGSIPHLKSLNLSGTNVTSLSALSRCRELEVLDISNTQVSDLSPIGDLTALRSLTAKSTGVASVAACSDLTELEVLNVSGSPVTSLSGLAKCTKLVELNFSGGSISDLSPLKSHTALTTLYAADNEITDLSALESCTALETVGLSGNQVSDLTPLANLPALITLNVSGNGLASLPAFSAGSPLRNLTASDNRFSDVSGLAGLSGLNYVNLDRTNVSDLSPLAGCETLVKVSAVGCPVSNLSVLTDADILVTTE